MTPSARKRGKKSPEARAGRGQRIALLLRKHYPTPTIALQYSSSLELLIAVILSAQCTDVRVNLVTPALFRKYTSAGAFANANQRELEEEIHSTGFFRNKAKNIIACCTELVGKHDGEVPRTMEELVQLPGVGRKTANCVLGGAFGIPSGIVVDTHVKRVAGLLGLTTSTDPEKIEEDLCAEIRQKDWIHFGNALVHHGRKVCDARKPLCSECTLRKECPSAGKAMG